MKVVVDSPDNKTRLSIRLYTGWRCETETEDGVIADPKSVRKANRMSMAEISKVVTITQLKINYRYMRNS